MRFVPKEIYLFTFLFLKSRPRHLRTQKLAQMNYVTQTFCFVLSVQKLQELIIRYAVQIVIRIVILLEPLNLAKILQCDGITKSLSFVQLTYFLDQNFAHRSFALQTFACQVLITEVFTVSVMRLICIWCKVRPRIQRKENIIYST